MALGAELEIQSYRQEKIYQRHIVVKQRSTEFSATSSDGHHEQQLTIVK